MAFYDMFERQCQKKGVTPTQVARDNGLTQQTVSHWKTRGSTPKAQTIQRLADYFGVSTDDLIDDETTVVIPARASFTGSLGARVRATTRVRIDATLDQMTPEGQSRVADYAEDILPRYRARKRPQAAPESTQAPLGEQSTTPPPDAPETPSEGE